MKFRKNGYGGKQSARDPPIFTWIPGSKPLTTGKGDTCASWIKPVGVKVEEGEEGLLSLISGLHMRYGGRGRGDGSGGGIIGLCHAW